MKKLAILASALCIFATSGMAVNAAPVAPDNHQPQQMSREEMMKQRKAHEAAFEQKLGLTEAQKAKAKELRIKGHKKMRPVMEEIKSKKQGLLVFGIGFACFILSVIYLCYTVLGFIL